MPEDVYPPASRGDLAEINRIRALWRAGEEPSRVTALAIVDDLCGALENARYYHRERADDCEKVRDVLLPLLDEHLPARRGIPSTWRAGFVAELAAQAIRELSEEAGRLADDLEDQESETQLARDERAEARDEARRAVTERDAALAEVERLRNAWEAQP